jgi:hypothetical protein
MRFWTQDVVVDPNDAGGNTWYAGVFEGWGTSGIQGTGGLFRTNNQGQSWTRINDNFRVNSCTLKPGSPNEMYFTTETDGLWHSSDASAGSPQFTQVSNYPFRHPMRIFFNPFNLQETWVTSFGSGIMLGGDSSSGIESLQASDTGFRFYPNPCSESVNLKLTNAPPSAVINYIISDITGIMILGGRLEGRKETTVSTVSLSRGIYILEVFANGKSAGNRKLVKY